VREHMQGHFDEAMTVHAAVIDGDLESAKEAASWIVEHERVDAPSGWDPHIASMRDVAQEVVDAESVGAAAHAASQLTRTCGGCHTALAPEATFTASPAPPDDPQIVPHMLRHNWAIERMWEGLTMSSVEAWNLGAQELSGTPVSLDAMTVEAGEEQAVSALAQRVHQLGAQAANEVAWGGRTDVYGQLLATCAACHQRVRQAGETAEME
jgi:mono/diheme cytochrome c family protein